MTTPSMIQNMPYVYTQLCNATRVGLDVECFVNFFCVGVTDFNGSTHVFIYDKYQDDRQLLIHYLNLLDQKRTEVVTFNGVHYDCPVLNYVRLNPEANNEDIKMFSDLVITDDTWFMNEDYKKYKWHHKWHDIDLFTYWSRMLRITKKISLKGLAVQLRYPVIQELPIKPDQPVQDDMRMKLLEYNAVHDLGILRYLLTKKFNWQGKSTTFPEMIDLRKAAIQKYGFNKSILSADAVKLGLNVALKLTDAPISEPRDFNFFYEVVDNRIKFKSHELKVLLTQVNKHHRKKPLHLNVTLAGVQFELKQGGLHSKNKPATYRNKPGYIFHSLDVAGYYPALAETLQCKLYEQLGYIRKERLKLKHSGQGKSPEANLLKLAANGTIGNFNQENSPVYDPYSFFRITINGQLFLLMLLEEAISLGCEPIMANTDGFELYVPEHKFDEFMAKCKEWEEYTGFELEHFKYNTLYMLNVNSYLGVFEDGSIKEKGWFVTDPDLGNKVDFLAVPKAVQNYLVNTTPLQDTFDRCCIYDFCGAQKIDKSYTMYLGDEQLPQRLNVYYVSKDGNFLFKERQGKKHALGNIKSTKVTIFNKYVKGPYNIDYNFYKRKAEEILTDLGLIQNQLTLFI